MMLQVNPIRSVTGILISMYICKRYYNYWIILTRTSCGHAIDYQHERIVRSQILDPWYWYSNVNWGPIKWMFRWILQVYGWKTQSIMRRYTFYRRDTWYFVTNKSVANHNVIPGTWSFKRKREPDWNIKKFKARYCVRGYVQ